MNIYTKVINPHHFLAAMSFFQRLFGRREPKHENKPTQTPPDVPAEQREITALSDKYPTEVSDRLKPYVPLIQNMITGLRKQAEKGVPDIGVFEMVYELIENPNPNWNLSHIRLAVNKPSSRIEGHEWIRYVELAVANTPVTRYICDKYIFRGDRQALLQYLDRPYLAPQILNMIPQMESDLDDI